MLKNATTIVLLIITTSTGCGTRGDAAQSCEAISLASARDECFHDQLITSVAADIETVITLATSIEDPIIRGAAIFRWIEMYNREIPRERGRALCEILSDREKTSCERRLYSAHLQR